MALSVPSKTLLPGLLVLVLGFGLAWSAGGATTTLVAKGSVWRYLDNGSNQGTNWLAPAFDDSAWASGPGELGYGDVTDGRPEATSVGYGPAANNKYITTYFRHTFQVTNAALYQSLKVHVMRDDGVIVYLNGTEVYRTNMPAGAVTYTTLASAAIAGADESAFQSNSVPSALLVSGTNVLAVEIHQAAVNSSDISFDLALIDSSTNLAPAVVLTQPTNGTVLTGGGEITLAATASDPNDSVTNVAFLAGTNLLGNGASNGAGSFTFTWSNAVPGYYVLRAVATDGFGVNATSTMVNVTIHDAVVRLSMPTNNFTVIGPTDVPLAALVTDTNVVLAGVEFYAGTNLIGSTTTEPWSFTWSNAPVGSHLLTAVAIETNSLSHTSAPVSLFINANQPPSVALTAPTNGATFGFGSNVTITASASDVDGSVTGVVFTVNGTVLAAGATAPHSAVWSDAWPGIYTLRAVAFDERGLGATSAPVAVTVTQLPTTLVAAGSVWRFLDNGSNQGTNWITPAFDDSAWASGPGELGYGDGNQGRPEATVVGWGPNEANKYITTYFRRAFSVGNPALYQSLTLNILRDDGAVVYLNGTEVYRNNLPAGAVSHTTLALVNLGAPEEHTYYGTNVPSSLLVAGTNVFAVEMHQFAANSADLSFDLSLLDNTTNLLPSVTIIAPTNAAAITAGEIILSATTSDLDGAVTNVVFLSGTNLLGPGTNEGTGTFSLAWSNNVPGQNALRAVATDSFGASATSSVVNVTLHDPVVRLLTPTNGAGFVIPIDVELTATITDTNAGVVAVNFHQGGALLGVVTNEPWNFTWTNAPVGSWTLTAVAVDTNLLSHTSAPVNITVATNLPPTVTITSPTNNAPFTPGSTIAITAAAADSDGTVTNVQFIANGTNLGSVASAPFTFNWANVTAATYALRAIATDNRGLVTTSAPVTVIVSAATVTRGPYLQMNRTNGVIVRWRTSQATGSRVAYGLEVGALTNLVDDAVSTNEHVLTVNSLPPDTKFYYSVGTTNGALAGGDTNHFFVTSPPEGAEKDMRLWVLGDPGTAPLGASQAANQKAVRDSYYNHARSSRGADLVLMLGDNVYNTGTDTEYQVGLFDIYPAVLRNTPFWPTIGNHDSGGSTATNSVFPYLSIFTLPEQGESGGAPSGTERYYSFDYGNVHFVCLDSQTSLTTTNGAMANWLRGDLEANTLPWTIAFWHHPPYTKGSHNSDTEPQERVMRENFVPILEAYGVDLVLGGHSHVYERSYLMNGHYGISSTFTDANKRDAGDGWTDGLYQKTGPDGAVYTVAGASGQVNGFLGTHPAMLRRLSLLSSMVLDISSNRLSAVLLGTTSNVLDRFVIVKGSYFASAPAAPTNLTAVITNSTQVRVTWSNNATNEIGFALERSLDGVNFTVVGGVFANFTNTLDSGLAASTTYHYRVRATNAAGGAVSPIVTVITPGPPRFLAQPVSQMVNVSSNVTFTTAVDGQPPFRYQWFQNSNALAGATNATLTLNNVQDANAGWYSVTVSNTAATSSTNALLTLNHFPVFSTPAFTRYWFGGFKARTNVFDATDPDGDSLTFLLATNSAAGVPITRRGEWFFYSPGPGFTNADTIEFSFADPRAAVSSGAASVAVNADTGPPKNLVQTSTEDTQTLNFAGVPGRTYAVQFTDELHPAWQTFTNIAADALGEFTAIDSPPKSITNRIYRSTIPRP